MKAGMPFVRVFRILVPYKPPKKRSSIKGVGGVWVKKYKLGSSYRTFSHGFRTFRRMQKLFELSRETSRENAPLRGPKWAKQESKKQRAQLMFLKHISMPHQEKSEILKKKILARKNVKGVVQAKKCEKTATAEFRNQTEIY